MVNQAKKSKTSKRSKRGARGLLAAGLTAGIVALAPFVAAAETAVPTLDAGDIAEGMRLFQTKGACASCHGWAGDGRKLDNQMPDGANLRESAMNRDLLVLTIKCGRPGTGMPAFDRLAYSDGRCFGLKQADLLARGLDLPTPPSTLQPNEVNLLADFIVLKILGKGPMDRAACVAFWGREIDTCNDFAK